jgi:hypothetical protein
MTYAFVQDVPANAAMYDEIRAELGDGPPPQGLVVHLAYEHGGGLRYVDVWDSQADWERFRVERVEPAVEVVLGRYGIPHDHDLVTSEDVALVDVWVGADGGAEILSRK